MSEMQWLGLSSYKMKSLSCFYHLAMWTKNVTKVSIDDYTVLYIKTK